VGAVVIGEGGERELGQLTSVATSLSLGPVALAYVRREIEPPADVVVCSGEQQMPARVENLPLLAQR
jgi:glycine cleavage system aminomethyltransferase T